MIRFEIQDSVARLTLDRPEARNALSLADWHALREAVADLRTSDVHVLVVTGAGGTFSAGADLGEFDAFPDDPAARAAFRTAMHGALDALARLPIATLAWVDGPCFGAGVAIAMACDTRLAAPAARFAITPAKMGIGYPQEDVARLVGLVGPGWASRLLFTGAAIDAATAERIGLVEMVAESPDTLIAELQAADSGSIAMLKRGIARACSGSISDTDQDAAFEALLGSDRLREALSRRRAARGLRAAEA